MKKRVIITLLAFLGGSILLPGMESSWGTMKKIWYFQEQGDDQTVLSLVRELKGGDLPRQEKAEMVSQLFLLGDGYLLKKNHELAEAVYTQCLVVKPDAWTVYNRLEDIRRSRGRFFPDIHNYWRQAHLIAGAFPSTFILVAGFFLILFFSALLVFFFFSLFLLWKYALLAIHDFLKAKIGTKRITRFGLLIVLLVWPLLLGGGWAIYPFLIGAFFWVYLGIPERKLFHSAMVILLICSLFLGFSKWLEKNASTREFNLHQRVYDGRLRNINLPGKLANSDLQVFYAYYLYESGRPDLAKKVVAAVPDSPRDALRDDLLGILNYVSGNEESSLENFRESLNIDDDNLTTIRNLTLALRKSDDQQLYESYITRFPVILDLRREIQREKYGYDILQMQFPRFWLWKHVLKLDHPRQTIVQQLKSIGLEVLRIPILIYLVVFLIYRMIFRHFFRFLGDSEFCSKCLKIVKRKPIEHSHVLCDDCYQLFMMKEPIFFDAKILKEKEINRRVRLKGIAFHLISLLIPGFALNFYERSRAFFYFAWIVFFLGGYAGYMSILFREVNGAAPLLFQGVGLIALLLYLSINLYSVKGWDNGF